MKTITKTTVTTEKSRRIEINGKTVHRSHSKRSRTFTDGKPDAEPPRPSFLRSFFKTGRKQ